MSKEFEEEFKLLEEMIDFINKEKIYLYLELRDYAIKNRPDWSEILRKKKYIRHIIAYTNSKRKEYKVKENCFLKYVEKGGTCSYFSSLRAIELAVNQNYLNEKTLPQKLTD